MKSVLPLILIAPLALTACETADAPTGENPLAGAPMAEDGSVDSCGAGRYADLIGQTNPAISVPEGTDYRTYRTGDPVTQDFAPKRLNFEYHRSGELLRVTCG